MIVSINTQSPWHHMWAANENRDKEGDDHDGDDHGDDGDDDYNDY